MKWSDLLFSAMPNNCRFNVTLKKGPQLNTEDQWNQLSYHRAEGLNYNLEKFLFSFQSNYS